MWCGIFFLLRKRCMWGTKTRSSSKRSRKGTSTARRWGPHDGSSSQCSGGGSGEQARGGPGVSCPCPLAARAMSPEQLSCSQSREKKPSKRQATKRWKTEHFRGRLPGSNLDLRQEQGQVRGAGLSRGPVLSPSHASPPVGHT